LSWFSNQDAEMSGAYVYSMYFRDHVCT